MTQKRTRTAARKRAVKKTAQKRPSPVIARFEISGGFEVKRERGILRVRVYGSPEQAHAAGVDTRVIDWLFGRQNALEPPDCQTLGELTPNGIWVKCIDNGCTGEGCHIFSSPRGSPDDEKDEGMNGAWAVPGRVYRCSCVYSD